MKKKIKLKSETAKKLTDTQSQRKRRRTERNFQRKKIAIKKGKNNNELKK